MLLSKAPGDLKSLNLKLECSACSSCLMLLTRIHYALTNQPLPLSEDKGSPASSVAQEATQTEPAALYYKVSCLCMRRFHSYLS